jgi:hypothetical protein
VFVMQSIRPAVRAAIYAAPEAGVTLSLYVYAFHTEQMPGELDQQKAKSIAGRTKQNEAKAMPPTPLLVAWGSPLGSCL